MVYFKDTAYAKIGDKFNRFFMSGGEKDWFF